MCHVANSETVVLKHGADVEIRYQRQGHTCWHDAWRDWEAIAWRVAQGKWHRITAGTKKARRILPNSGYLSETLTTCHSCGSPLNGDDRGFGTPRGKCKSCLRSPVS